MSVCLVIGVFTYLVVNVEWWILFARPSIIVAGLVQVATVVTFCSESRESVLLSAEMIVHRIC